MKSSRFSAVIIGTGATALVAGAAMAGSGIKDLVEAQRTAKAADDEYQKRAAEFAQRREQTEGRVRALRAIQEEALNDVVVRMRDFLHRHEKQVRNVDHLLVDGVDVTTELLRDAPKTDGNDLVMWAAGASSSVLFGAGASTAVTKAAHTFGKAGTGKRISELYGAAKEIATAALFGGGPKSAGGGGIARGELVLKLLKGGTGTFVTGAVTKGAGMKALTEAKAYKAEVNVWCADRDVDEKYLAAVDGRISELKGVLNALKADAVLTLDALEDVSFDIDEHGELLQSALILVHAVCEVATTPLLDTEGDLDPGSELVTVKYRTMVHKQQEHHRDMNHDMQGDL